MDMNTLPIGSSILAFHAAGHCLRDRYDTGIQIKRCSEQFLPYYYSCPRGTEMVDITESRGGRLQKKLMLHTVLPTPWNIRLPRKL